MPHSRSPEAIAPEPSSPEPDSRGSEPDARDPMRLLNRNVYLSGRRTSVTLERIFWDALSDMARAQAVSTRVLIERIHADNRERLVAGQNLTSVLRVTATAWYRNGGRAVADRHVA